MKKAVPVFWKHGFADTGVQALEKATGVNKSGLYSEFKSKEDLYLASLQYYIENRHGKELLTREPLGWANVDRFLQVVRDCPDGQTGCFAINSMGELAVESITSAALILHKCFSRLPVLRHHTTDKLQGFLNAKWFADMGSV